MSEFEETAEEALEEVVGGTTDSDFGAPSGGSGGGSFEEGGAPLSELLGAATGLGELAGAAVQELVPTLSDIAADPLDLAGAVDRASARQELADRFDIIAEGQGAVAGNSVTREELEAIARQYSDIRRGKTNLQLDFSQLHDADLTDEENAEAAAIARDATMDDLASLLQTESGRGLVGALANDPNGIVTTLSAIDDPNAAATTSQMPGHGGTPHSQVRYAPGADMTSETPASWAERLPVDPSSGRVRSDVVLYHELVHAYHGNQGSFGQRPAQLPAGPIAMPHPWDMAGLDGQQRPAEAQAVGLGVWAEEDFTENRYREERQQLAMAADCFGINGYREGDEHLSHRDHYLFNDPAAASHGHGHGGGSHHGP